MFGDVNVKVEDGNLGRSSSTGTGTQIKIGISNVESKSPILISGTMNAKKIKEKVGNTPLADACIDAVEWGASSIYCIPVKAGTAGTIGEIVEDKKGYGTFDVKGSPNNAYDIVVEVMDAGECNEGKKTTKKSKSKKSKSKSPAKDSRSTSKGKKAAKKAVK